MNDYKSIQDLIIKAALYDGVSATISAYEKIGAIDVIRVTFSKDDRYTDTFIDLADRYGDEEYRERANLYACKQALYKLLFAPYEEIEVNKESYQC